MKLNDNEYFALKRHSYSKLGGFDRGGPQSLIAPDKKSSALSIGSLVDHLLTNVEPLSTEFYITKAIKPTASLGTLADAVLAAYGDIAPRTEIEDVVHIAKVLGLWSSIKKPEVYQKKIDTKQFWDYLTSEVKSKGKKVVTVPQLALAKKMVSHLKSDKVTSRAFDTDGGNVEVIFQEVMLWDDEDSFDSILGIENPEHTKGFRCKFDILRADHKNKTLQFVDIKTMEGPIDDFEKSFYMWRYYFQDALYQDGLEKLRDADYEGYTLLEPYNIVSSQESPEYPKLFEIDSKWLQAGREGFKMGKRHFRGYKETKDLYEWHEQNEVYDQSQQEWRNGGVKTIKFEGWIKGEIES